MHEKETVCLFCITVVNVCREVEIILMKTAWHIFADILHMENKRPIVQWTSSALRLDSWFTIALLWSEIILFAIFVPSCNAKSHWDLRQYRQWIMIEKLAVCLTLSVRWKSLFGKAQITNSSSISGDAAMYLNSIPSRSENVLYVSVK